MSNTSANVVVLFADVIGSTRLYETLGDVRALDSIGLCVNIMRAVTAERGGRVVKTIGDEVMSVFPAVLAGVQAASDMQTRVNLQDSVSGERLAIRIGLQFGPVIEKGGDVFGDSVNVAARMAALAKAGQIITTRETAEALPPDMHDLIRYFDKMTVRGKEQEIAICEIIWQHNEDLTNLASRMGTHSRSVIRLRLRQGEREIVFSPDQRQLTLGRDAACDVVLADRKASRQHARIERRRDKYVLIDQSSNGTYLTIQGQPENRLRREEAVLHGRGSISFGHSHTVDQPEVVAFDVE